MRLTFCTNLLVLEVCPLVDDFFFSPSDLKDIEKTALNLLRMENTDIKQKQDPVRYCDISDIQCTCTGTYMHTNSSLINRVGSDYNVSLGISACTMSSCMLVHTS